eukprot:4139213-Amphidinium_carterae.1
MIFRLFFIVSESDEEEQRTTMSPSNPSKPPSCMDAWLVGPGCTAGLPLGGLALHGYPRPPDTSVHKLRSDG